MAEEVTVQGPVTHHLQRAIDLYNAVKNPAEWGKHIDRMPREAREPVWRWLQNELNTAKRKSKKK